MDNLNNNINKLSGIECFWCKCKHLEKIENDKYICKACGMTNYFINDEINSKFTIASSYLKNYRFFDADSVYQELSKYDNPETKAYGLYGRLLSTYGIISIRSNYFTDANNRSIPTFSRYDKNVSSLLDSSYYKQIKSLEFSGKVDLLDRINRLDREYKEIGKHLKEEPIYDVFICVKISSMVDNNAKTSSFTNYATTIYNELTGINRRLLSEDKPKLKVFCSEITKPSSHYDSEIFSALARSKTILVISESKEHLESDWVQSEWRRWLHFMNIGMKEQNSLVALFTNKFEIPSAFQNGMINIYNDTHDVYNKIFELAKKNVKIDNKENIEKLLRESDIEMSFGNYDKAEEINKGLCHNTDDYRPWLNLVDILIEKNVSIDDKRYLNFLNRAIMLAPNKKKEIENKYKEFLDEDIKKNEENDKEEARKIDNEIYRLSNLYDSDVTIADIKSFETIKKRIEKLKKKNDSILKYCKSIKFLDSISRNMDNFKEKLKKKDSKEKDKSKSYNSKNKERNKINKKIIINIVLVVLAVLILFISISTGVNKEAWSRYLIIGSGILLTNIVIYIFLKYNKLSIVLEILQIILLGLSFVFIFISKEFGFYSLVLILCSLVESAINFENDEFIEDLYAATTYISFFVFVVFIISFGACYCYKDFNYSNLKLIEYNGESREVVEIESGTITIASGAFLGHDELLEIIIPESVTTIENLAFSGCEGLKSIFIPENVATIGDGVFSECSSMTEIIVDEDNKFYKSIDGVLYTYDGKTLVAYPTGKTDSKYDVIEGTTTIGNKAFYEVLYLTNVILPDSVEAIKYNAFNSCYNLNFITIGSGMNKFEEGTFAYCNSLKKIYYNGTEDEWNNIIKDDGFLNDWDQNIKKNFEVIYLK